MAGCHENDGAPAAANDKATETAPASETAPTPVAPPPPAAALAADSGEHHLAHRWSRRLGGPTRDAARGVATGPDGLIAIAGYTTGKADFGATAQKAYEPKPAAKIDAYVASLDAGGKTRWARTFGGAGDDIANSVAIDSHGNVIVAGTFAQTLTFADGTLASAGADDMFVVKLTSDGRRLWAHRFGGRDIDALHYVTTDREDRILITGVFRDKVRVGETILTSAGDADIFMAVLSPEGEPVWAKGFGSSGPDWGRAAAADDAGFIAFAGEISGEVDLGTGPLKSVGNRDLVLARLSPAGEPVWSQRFGSEFNEVAVGMAIDPARHIAITGSFDGTIDFGCGPLKSAGESDAFIASFDEAGKCRFAQRFGDEREDIGAGVATDRFGNIAATGWFWSTFAAGGKKLESNGRKDVYLTLLSPSGKVLYAQTFGDKSDDQGRAVAINADGDLVVAGTFRYTVNFGGEDIVYAHTDDQLLAQGDAFVAKFSN